MSTMTELINQGVTKMRLSFWKSHAYVEPNPEGPWAKLYDVGAGLGSGDPISVLIGMCDQDDRWEPFESRWGR